MSPDLQKASMWKRLSAGIFDAILLSILAVGIGYSKTLEVSYARYEAEYGIVFDITQTEGDTITVTGRLKNYNGTIEFNSGCTLG